MLKKYLTEEQIAELEYFDRLDSFKKELEKMLSNGNVEQEQVDELYFLIWSAAAEEVD